MGVSDTICTEADTLKAAVSNSADTVTELVKFMHEAADKWPKVMPFAEDGNWEVLGNLATNSIITGVAFTLILVLIGLLVKHLPTTFRDLSLKWSFLAVWFLGFVVYDVGMCTGQYVSLVTNAPMAIIYAFRIFLFDGDVSELHEPFHGSWEYSLLFALVHFLAAIISTLFLIKYLGYNILAGIRMWAASRVNACDVGETYVFWGLNQQTENLIYSIRKHYLEIDSDDYRIVIVRTGKDNDKLEEQSVLARVFDFIATPTAELDELQKLGCLTTASNVNLAGINRHAQSEDIIGRELKLKCLRRLLAHKTTGRIHLLFLNDDEKENLHDVALLLNDTTIRNFAEDTPENHREAILYCLARYNSVHRVIEDQSVPGRIKVKVVDSSHINVEMLKEKTDLLPVNFVSVEKDATVSTAFNALVVGFSEVGQEAVRFLYEFGAFVKYDGKTGYDKPVRSEFHLDVVDKDMSDLAGVFVANAPSIKLSMPFVENGYDPEALIALHHIDCRSVQFYEKLAHDWITKLNYVVIATEDDELNISLGVRIFKAATRYRKDMDKFCILVRAHSDDDGHIRHIAWHYNRLWKAYEAAPADEFGKRLSQTAVKNEDRIEMPIRVFGLDKTTFTYGNIIADDLEHKAREYYKRYMEMTDPGKKPSVSHWDDRHDTALPRGEFSPTYYGMMMLRRQESQDIANSLHEATKRKLIDEALVRCGLSDFEFSKLTRKPNTLKYIWPKGTEENDEINRILTVIAQTEHLRWNASHEILGYMRAGKKDEVRLHHDCLTDWTELGETICSYDNNVSDFVLGIKPMDE